MTTARLDTVGRLVYRHLLRRAKQFEEDPLLKALITRNVLDGLPQPLDGVVAKFLGGAGQLHYWPREDEASDSVLAVVRDAFRHPPAGATIDGGFQGLRYLTALLNVAQRHDLLASASIDQPSSSSSGSGGGDSRAGPAAERQQQQQQRLEQPWGVQPGMVQPVRDPGAGVLLVAHPSVDGFFRRSVVLLCQHSPAYGAYGLCINKPLGGSVGDLTAKIRELRQGGGAGGGGSSPALQLVASLAGLVLRAPMQLKPWQLSSAAGPRHPLDLPTSLLQSIADAAGTLQDGGLQGLEDLLEDARDAEGPRSSSSSSSSSTPAVTAELFMAAVGGGGAVRALPLGALQQRICSSLAGVLEEEEEEEEEEEGAGRGGLEGFPGWYWANEGRGGGGSLGGWKGSDLSSAEQDTEDESDPLEDEGESELELDPTIVVVVESDGRVTPARGLVPVLPWGADPARAMGSRRRGGPRAAHTPLPAAAAGAAAHPPPPKAAALLEQFKAIKLKAISGSLAAQQAASDPEAASEGTNSEQQQKHLMPQDTAAEDSSSPGSGDFLSIGSSMASSSVSDSSSNSSSSSAEQPLTGDGGSSTGFAGSGWSTDEEPGVGSGWSTDEEPGVGSGWSTDEELVAGSEWSTDEDLWVGSGPTVGQVLELFDSSQMFRGGPVEGLQLLHCSPEFGGEPVLPPSSDPLAGQEGNSGGSGSSKGVFVGARLKDAAELVGRGRLSPEDVKLFIGDSGWGAGQLEGELSQGTWAMVRADSELHALFSQGQHEQLLEELEEGEEGDMWLRLLAGMGPRHAALRRIPDAVWRDLLEIKV